MKVFLAGIIQGSLVAETIHQQDWRDPIRQVLAEHLPDAEVYCHYSAHPDSITYDIDRIRRTFVDGVQRAADSDLVIAYLPSASMGTAIEIYEAARNGAMVLTITPMVANWVVRCYSDRVLADVEALRAFLAEGGLDRLDPAADSCSEA